MKSKTSLNRFLLMAGLILLQSCQFVTAQSSDNELTFIPVHGWETLGKDTPKGLLEQFKLENRDTLEFNGIDARRFLVHTHKKLGQKTVYVIDPRAECPEWGCPDYNDYLRLYAPFCGARQNFCLVMFYVEENGKFRSVFQAPFGYQGDGKDGSLYAFSVQQQDGLPICLEVKGYSVSADVNKLLPPRKEDERYVSRYCYDGQKYELNKIYTERWDWLIEFTERNRKK